ncbi:hypothetical protein GALL_526340 [mine drainage metagenome]|uniref:Uncharacterized protein n=1 Tax=mine drainage metagenome TaxID=410659 RepID=A0A1J5PKI2_9ZZZZ
MSDTSGTLALTLGLALTEWLFRLELNTLSRAKTNAATTTNESEMRIIVFLTSLLPNLFWKVARFD